MRKSLVAILALPVVLVTYGSVALQRSARHRFVVALFITVAIGAGALGLQTPSGTVAGPPATDPPLELENVTRIETNGSPDAPVRLHFPAPMDRYSVAALLDVQPDVPVKLSWDVTGSLLTVEPVPAWQPAVLHTVTIEAGALEASGRPITEPVRAVFLTRPPTRATIGASEVVGGRATIGTSFVVGFDRAVDEATLALSIQPATTGSLELIQGPGDAAGLGDGVEYRFVPDAPLAPATEYRVALADGVRDTAGAPVVLDAPLVIQTSTAPSVVRFRPRSGASGVALDATLSVRFSEPMDRASTAAAWSVVAGGRQLTGKVTFAEDDTVLVFDPDETLGHGQSVTMSVGPGATSTAGVALVAAASASFTTLPKPTPRPTPVPAPKASPTPSSGGGGGSTGSASWAAVEAYYLRLMNCTRTGGTVSSTGSCSGAGSRSTAPLWIDAGITAKVARPYARLLATNNQCSHFIGGNPGDRLRAAGYTSYIWAENLGCRSGDPYAAVLGSHLFFQAERSTNGGHYVNLMNPAYDRVGIGVWVASNRVRLVVDFYHPR